MEALLSRLAEVHLGRLPRYALTIVIVGAFFLLHQILEPWLEDYPFLLLVPAVFISALVFGSGCGIFAAGLSTLCAIYFFIESGPSVVLHKHQIIPFSLFVLICFGVALISESLHNALKRATRAEKEKDLLFQELSHRMKNNLQIIISSLTLQARSQSDCVAKEAIQSAISRVRVIADSQEHLHPGRVSRLVNMVRYLCDLCQSLGDALRGFRAIAVDVEAETMELEDETAVPIGLIVNELVTNAFKYAFPGDMEGTIKVTFRARDADWLELLVEDSGIGCPSTFREGLGTRLVGLLVRQLRGSIEKVPANPGCRVIVLFRDPRGRGA